jgi:hypothetical protein
VVTIDNAFGDSWHAINGGVPLNTDAAIYKAWCSNYQEWGSPIGGEVDLDNGGVYQVFARAIVQYTDAGGIEVVTR